MRIGVNALYLIPGGVGGTEIYLRNLLRALSRIDATNQYFVFTNLETGVDLLPGAGNFHQISQGVRAMNRPRRLLWEQTKLPSAVRRLRLDCLLNAGFTAPAIHSCPNVTVFHDLQHKRHPEHFRWFDLPFWNFFLWVAVKRSRILLADSEATRLDLVRYYGVAANRLIVAPLGVEEEFFAIAGRREKTEPLLLCVSTLHPHKNLQRLVRVFGRVHQRHPEFRLVIAGLRGFHAEALETLIADLSLGEAISLTGWIPREALYELFRRARAFVYPSTFEGFGLPVVEAMAAGVPMACSSIEPLRSIVGDAAIQFEPDDEEGMHEALLHLIHDESMRNALTEKGRTQALRYRWEESARITLEALISSVVRLPSK